jgi:hypothetical protein
MRQRGTQLRSGCGARSGVLDGALESLLDGALDELGVLLELESVVDCEVLGVAALLSLGVVLCDGCAGACWVCVVSAGACCVLLCA